jgi:hypothetical protein
VPQNRAAQVARLAFSTPDRAVGTALRMRDAMNA